MIAARSSRTLRPLAALAAAGALCLLASGGCARHVPRTHTIEIRRFLFTPARLELAEGDTVVWVNHDIVPHTATSREGGWDSGSIDVEQSRRTVATQPGTQPYLCTFHPVMKGELVVR